MILRIDEKGQVKLNDVIIPGLIKKVSVVNSIIFDEKDKAGGSGKYKVLSGWDDADVSIDLELIDEVDLQTGKIIKTYYDFLADLNSMFIKTENNLPVIYTISHPHTNSRKLKRFIFSELQSDESDGCISCSLKFIEYESYIAKTEKINKPNPKPTGDEKKKNNILNKEQQKKITNLKNKGNVNWGGY